MIACWRRDEEGGHTKPDDGIVDDPPIDDMKLTILE
jgi:hypothetical protein